MWQSDQAGTGLEPAQHPEETGLGLQLVALGPAATGDSTGAPVGPTGLLVLVDVVAAGVGVAHPFPHVACPQGGEPEAHVAGPPHRSGYVVWLSYTQPNIQYGKKNNILTQFVQNRKLCMLNK